MNLLRDGFKISPQIFFVPDICLFFDTSYHLLSFFLIIIIIINLITETGASANNGWMQNLGPGEITGIRSMGARDAV